MKCLALRLGAVLVRELGLRTVAEAELIPGQYYDLARYPAKARYVLEELIGAGKAPE